MHVEEHEKIYVNCGKLLTTMVFTMVVSMYNLILSLSYIALAGIYLPRFTLFKIQRR